MTDPADRLAEAVQQVRQWHMNKGSANWTRLGDALAAWDADRERRQAEQDVIHNARAYVNGDTADSWLLERAIRRLDEITP